MSRRPQSRRAIEAGADGVEIHGANAYLIQQFFAPSANTCTDEYGGSIENRARFAIEVAREIAREIGADRTVIRLSPGTTMWGIDEGAEAAELYRYLVGELDKLGLAYLHIMHQGNETLLEDIRKRWTGKLSLNRPGRPREQVGADAASGMADLEAYGAMVLANPDFVERLKTYAEETIPPVSLHLYASALDIRYAMRMRQLKIRLRVRPYLRPRRIATAGASRLLLAGQSSSSLC